MKTTLSLSLFNLIAGAVVLAEIWHVAAKLLRF
jgi:hypothetical protein